MIPRALLLVATLAFAVACPPPLPAQSAHDLAASGVAAYRAVRYDEAASLLRRALAGGDNALSDSARAVAYAYLAATEFFRGRRHEADAAARQALAADPGYRPDTLAFPPDVSNAFGEVRRGTRYVRIRAPADTTIQPGGHGYPVRLYVSASHELTAVIVPESGTAEEVLFDGAVLDSADLVWPALERGTQALPEGRFVLEVRSKLPGGNTRVVRLPLVARPIRPDTLLPPMAPADSLFLPERAKARSPVLGVSLGLVAGAVTFLLPTVVAQDGIGTRTRYALGGALGVAGIVALFTGSRGDPIPANEAANRALMDAWRREADAVRGENERRRGRTTLRIVASQGTIAEASR
jgi:hypothetical protein